MQIWNPRILLAGSYGHGNTGDEAILAVIVNQLRVRMQDVRLVVVAGDTETVQRQFGVDTVSWADWAAIAQAVQNSDLVIQGGGGIFFDYTGFHPWNLFENGAPDLAHHGAISLLARLCGKPYMIYAVGVGPLTTESGREMVGVAHSLADKITVRDPESKLLLEEIGLESNRVQVTADPAFSLQPASADRAMRILGDHGINLKRPVIAVTPRLWNQLLPQSEWEETLADAVSEFALTKQAQVLLIAFQKGYDETAALRIQRLLPNNETFILRSGYTPQEIAGVIGGCDLLIGMRLHSILFAILTATPAVAIAYDTKVRSLTRRIGHEEICINLTDLSELRSLFFNVWERREELSHDFARACIDLRERSEGNADLACELLNAKTPAYALSPESLDMLRRAFYGRLQAIRVRDHTIAKQNETKDLREVIGIIENGPTPPPLRSSGVYDSSVGQQLREFLHRVVIESTEHLIVIYASGVLSKSTATLVEAFADRGIPVVLICEVEQAAAQAEPNEKDGMVFQLPIGAMVASWDEVLYVPLPRACGRVLLFRSADQNTFRLVNHAYAMAWATVYYPDPHSEQDRHDRAAERYVLSNVEYVIVGSESRKNDMQSNGAHNVSMVRESLGTDHQVEEILALVDQPLSASPVQLAIKGASHG